MVGRCTRHRKLGWWCTRPRGWGGGDVVCLLAVGEVLDGMVVWALVAVGRRHGLFMSVNDGHGWSSLL